MATDKEKPSFENILEILGMPGRYQLTQLTMTLLSKFIIISVGLSFIFLGYTPPHVCNKVNETSLLIDNDIDFLNYTSNVKVMYEDECQISITATNDSAGNEERDVIKSIDCLNGRHFYTANGKPTTYISEWDLVCESAGIAEWSQTIFIFGQVVGGFIMSQLVDRIGRKPVFVFCTFAVFITEALVLVVPSIYAIYAIKFVSGFCYQGVLTSYLVFGMEILLPRHRQIYGVVICFQWVFQLIVMGGIAYLLQDQDWRYLQGIIVACGVVCVLFPFVFTESPRWLAANNEREKALAILKMASDQNKKDFLEIKKALDAFMTAQHIVSNDPIPLIPVSSSGDGEEVADNCSAGEAKAAISLSTEVEKQTILAIFRSKRLLFITLITMYIWGTCNMTYYGLYMTSSSIAGDRFLNYILMAVVEIPANFAILFMLKRLSRRFVLMTFLALSAVSLMTSSIFVTFVDGYAYVSTILFIFGKFAITCAFNTVFIYTPEIFPTNLRGAGTGFCSSVGRCGSMIAPFLRPLYNVAPWAPGLIFTTMCAVGFFLIPFLPETKDKNLPSNVSDLKKEKIKTKL